MSSIARWTYTNIAKVKPFNGVDMWGNESYGTEYQIACTWTAVEGQERRTDANGMEYVVKQEIFTEDARPQFMDKIKIAGEDEFDTIRSRTNWDMSPFADTPDFKLVTG